MSNTLLYTSLIWLTCAGILAAIAVSRRHGATALWAAGNLAGGVGLLSYLFRPHLPEPVSLLVTNIGLLLVPLLLIAALRTVAGRAALLWPGLLLCGLVAMINFGLGTAPESLGFRVGLGVISHLVLMIPLLPLLKDRDPAVRLLAGLLGVLLLLRPIRFLIFLGLSLGSFDSPLITDEAFALLVGLIVVGVNVSFLWLLAVQAAAAHAASQVRLMVALSEARDRAEAASRAKSAFIASLSHELKTPLNAILGFNQLLATDQRAPLPPHQKEWSDQVEVAGHQLLRLVNDLLDLARIEAGRVSLDVGSVPLDPVLDAVVRSQNPQATAAGIAVTHLPSGLSVRADPLRLRQILANLLSNAIKYNRAGGSVSLTAVPLADGRVQVCVADTGPGIVEARRGELFQPFSRLGAENSGIEGTGIGLTLVRQLTNAMGGEVAYAEREGGGSEFRISLPAA